MGLKLEEIAGQLNNDPKKVQLIYAFNGTGKTRLSSAFKECVAPKNDDEDEPSTELSRTKILYYNAFTEDLFYWDNDLENDAERKLIVQPNSFTDWILREQGQDQNIIGTFQQYTNDKLTPNFSTDFSEITFSLERGTDEEENNIKISKGEESIFVWAVFYALMDQAINNLNTPEEGLRETDVFNQLDYIFIDDPVSSLDDNNVIELAVNLAALISKSSSGIKFVITTHNPLFYNVLYSELSLKNGYIFSKFDDGTYELGEKRGAANKAFSYHLHIKKILDDAIQGGNIERYHFNLLRNLYEKTAAFFGYEKWTQLLDTLEDDKSPYIRRLVNYSSHSSLANEEIAELTEPEKQIIKQLLDNLTKHYGKWPVL